MGEQEAKGSAFAAALEAAARHAIAHLDGLPDRAVQPPGTVESLRGRLSKPLAQRGLPAEQVLSELARDCADGLMGSPSSRFFAWVIGGSLPAALGADWLTSAWDQNAHCYSTAPAAAIAEEVVGSWLKDLLGLPEEASFALVTGCQMAHVTCLSAARHALLARRGWDVEEKGLSGAAQITVLASGQLHGSIERAVRLIGLGRSNLIALPTDANGRLSPETLAQALDAHAGSPTIVTLCAGDLNIGAFDNFEALIPLAHARGAWVHIDGAFGLWAAASSRHRHLLAGAERADSWATDGHKWLNVPYDSGYAFVADKLAHASAMSYRASYISYAAEARDEADWNPEWSRRARGFATYAAIRELGREGVSEMIERCCDCAKAIVSRIGALTGSQMLWLPQLNQGLVRFLDERAGATAEDHDRRTDAVIAEINAAGEAFFSGTTWRGQRAMRVSVCNWATDHGDVERTVQSVAMILRPGVMAGTAARHSDRA
jgi:glutamate/tyrosine decarboxylase-like PLP-dependent enzyme